MSTELLYLTYVTAFTGLLWVPYILDRIAVRGLIDAVGYPENPRPQSLWAQRLMKAHSNAVENLIVFAALVLSAHAVGLTNAALAAACVVYFSGSGRARLCLHIRHSVGTDPRVYSRFLRSSGDRVAASGSVTQRSRVIDPNHRGDSMNRRPTAIAFLFSLLAVLPTAIAQSPPPPGTGAAALTNAPPPERTRPSARANRDAGADADARLCLEFPTNLEVIRCAEKYRQHKRTG